MEVDTSDMQPSAIWPFTKFATMLNIARALLKNGPEGKYRDALSQELHLSPSMLSNTFPIMKELGLIEASGFRNTLMRATDDARSLILLHSKGDVVGMKELGGKLIAKSSILTKALEVVNERPDIENYILGRELATYFGKVWVSPTSYTGVGRSCIDILWGFQAIPNRKRRSTRRSQNRNPDYLIPTSAFNQMIGFILQLDVSEPRKIVRDDYSDRQKWMMADRMRSLTDLGLANAKGGHNYILTEMGEKVKIAKIEHDDATLTLLISQAILNHPVGKKIIDQLIQYEKAVSWNEVGQVIALVNRREWSMITKKSTGQKFLSWLKAAGMAVPNHEKGKYHIRMKETVEAQRQVKIEEAPKTEQPSFKVLERRDGSPSEIIHELIMNISGSLLLSEYDWWVSSTFKGELLKLTDQLESSLSGYPIARYFVPRLEWLITKAFETKDIDYLKEAGRMTHSIDYALSKEKENSQPQEEYSK